MVSIGTVKLAVLVMTLGILAMASTSIAFAQKPCGEQPYLYNVGCLPLDTAHVVGGVLVVSIIVFAILWGIAERHYHMVPTFK